MKKKPAEDPKPPEWGYTPVDNLERTIRQYFREHKPRYRGEIQRATDAAYGCSLDSIGKSLGFPLLTDQERETIKEQSKYLRRKQRGLRNKAAADKGNLERGRQARVKELEAQLEQEGVPNRERTAKIHARINKETPERPITMNYVQKLRRRLRSK